MRPENAPGGEELVRVPLRMEMRWRYGTGRYYSRLFAVLREEGRLEGVRCPACRRVYLPPRPLCGNCRREMHDWVPVGLEGTVEAFSVVYLPILDPARGEPRPVPYGMALVRLDGADTALNHYLAETDLARMRIGIRVRAVLREPRQGNMGDILHFVPVEDGVPAEEGTVVKEGVPVEGRAPTKEDAARGGRRGI